MTIWKGDPWIALGPEGRYEVTIRGKWLMDGALTLTDAADQLRRFADFLVEKESEGWQLTDDGVADDYGHVEASEELTEKLMAEEAARKGTTYEAIDAKRQALADEGGEA